MLKYFSNGSLNARYKLLLISAWNFAMRGQSVLFEMSTPTKETCILLALFSSMRF